MDHLLTVVNQHQGTTISPDQGVGEESLFVWMQRYWRVKVLGGPEGTVRAKRLDLELFAEFFTAIVGCDLVDFWTPSVTKSFKNWLQQHEPKRPRRKHGKAYAPTSINRILATCRHFARFVAEQRAFEAGSPFDGVKDLVIREPEWKGVDDISLMRLRAALDQVTQLSKRRQQMPFRNRAVFTVALNTGLRAGEIQALEFEQFQGKCLRNVRGKGEQVDDVYLSKETREELTAYIDSERGDLPGPLFVTNRGGRMLRQQIDRFLRRVCNQANAKLGKDEQIALSAHKLRHTGVKRVYERHGQLAAKRFSRHRSFAQLERYASQTMEEHEVMVDGIWNVT